MVPLSRILIDYYRVVPQLQNWYEILSANLEYLLAENEKLRELKQIPTHVKIYYINHIIKNNNKCSICLSKMNKKEELFLTYCGHLFHTNCINTSMKYNCKCPMCRVNISCVLSPL